MIREGYIYVDKTRFLYKLIREGNYYFLSRPRRFGKSLLVSTLKEIFSGNRELFSGLWIEDKIDWVARPVIAFDFSRIAKRAEDLPQAIELELQDIAAEFGVALTAPTNAGKLQELVQQVGAEQKVAILVDEYDKPIIDHIADPVTAEVHREILKDLYSVIKGNDRFIAFFFLTGVSKFSHVSIFSDLNNLYDITTDRAFACMLGYTEEELWSYFPDYLAQLEAEYRDHFANIIDPIRDWYNGYSWDGKQFVFNPFSILNLFRKRLFQDYWFSTGTPTFLIRLVRTQNYSIFDLKNRKLDVNYFNKFEVDNIEVNSLLFQAGYLTMRDYDPVSNIVTLDFPNREVEQSFNIHLLAEFSGRS
ncbi:MAG: AAA family ATPase, partial [Bacteroidota bacterium]